MKSHIPAFLAAVITGDYNMKQSLIKFFIGLLLVLNVIAHLLVFIIYKPGYQPGMITFQRSLILGIAAISSLLLVLLMARWITQTINKQRSEKNTIEKMIHKLETRALRAQMNPHFIFNCMNSIKALIQRDDNDKAVSYLTTFSKLLRTIFDNSDNCEISLFDEIETCRIYTQLESLRFYNKIQYNFMIDETINLKSIMVPALILQPFIENAIWHGLMPKENGGRLTVKICKTDHTINCIIEDDGIGREVSKQNKFLSKDSIHKSKGEHLTQARLDLNNLLNERNAKIKITDKKDENNTSAGTIVILSFMEY